MTSTVIISNSQDLKTKNGGHLISKTSPEGVNRVKEPNSAHQYVKLIEKLPSTGPLNITDLNEFLAKSKIDFETLYKDRTISKLKIKDFKIIRKLGSGAFGTVLLVEGKEDNTKYAVKVIDKRSILKHGHFRYILNEKRILQSINFPFVVYLKDFFVDFDYLYFVLPFIPGGDFNNYLNEHQPLSEPHARFYISQLVLALEYLHYLGVIHRDVKPENIMMDAFGYIKLTDFGQCIRSYTKDRTWTFTGTPQYMAPEIIQIKGYNSCVDWWALSVTLYEMCAGQRPFENNDLKTIYKLILNIKYDIPATFSKSLTNLIQNTLIKVPVKRIANFEKGAKEIKSHAWFSTTDWLSILNRTVEAPYLPQISE